MFNFNKSLFIPSHKSFYNDIDIKILNESRTVAPSGLLFDKFHSMGKTETDEIRHLQKDLYILLKYQYLISLIIGYLVIIQLILMSYMN